MNNKRSPYFGIKETKGRLAMVILPLTCAAVLAGCQWNPFGTTKNAEGVSKEKLITDAVTLISSAKSMDADIDAGLSAKAQLSGVSIGVNAVTGLNVKSAKADNASHALGNITFDLIGEKGSVDIETYSLDKEDMRYTYIKQSDLFSGDSGWIVTKNPKDEKGKNSSGAFSRISLGNLLDLYNSAKDSLAGLTLQDGTQKKDGKECYVVEGTLKGDDVKDLTDGLGFSIPGIPGLPQPDLSGIDADVKMYFEKESGQPYLIDMKIPEVTGVSEGNPLTFGIDDIEASVKFNSFNKNNEIKVPGDVENSALVSVDSGDIQEKLNAK